MIQRGIVRSITPQGKRGQAHSCALLYFGPTGCPCWVHCRTTGTASEMCGLVANKEEVMMECVVILSMKPMADLQMSVPFGAR